MINLNLTPTMRQMVRFIGLSLGVILLVAFGVICYMWWSRSYQERAFNSYAQAVEVYEQAVSAKDVARGPLLERAYDMFTKAAKDFKSATCAPFERAYAASILYEQGKTQEARAALKAVLGQFKAGTIFAYLFTTKYAIMSLLSGDNAAVSEGKDLLGKLETDAKNPCADMARYYHGAYLFDRLDYDGALVVWQPLLAVAKATKDPKSISVWAQQAQARIEYRS